MEKKVFYSVLAICMRSFAARAKNNMFHYLALGQNASHIYIIGYYYIGIYIYIYRGS